jgi:hypothetical protein
VVPGSWKGWTIPVFTPEASKYSPLVADFWKRKLMAGLVADVSK